MNRHAWLAGLAALAAAGWASPGAGRLADQQALEAFAPLVGGWRGTGMVERGRPKGGWVENANWSWKLTPDTAALAVEFARGKHLASGTLRPGKAPGSFEFAAVLADGSARTFTGKPAEGGGTRLVLLADGPPGPDAARTVRRLTIRPLHDTRLVILLEGQDPDRKSFVRLGEVGYTREGVSFAAGDTGPACIVTEGRGTTPVSYKGKTYYVCCSGCRDLFNEDPERVLAEAEARRKAKAGGR